MAELSDDVKKEVHPNLYISQFSLRNSEKQSEFIITRATHPLCENTFITNLELGLLLFSYAGLIQSWIFQKLKDTWNLQHIMSWETIISDKMHVVLRVLHFWFGLFFRLAGLCLCFCCFFSFSFKHILAPCQVHSYSSNKYSVHSNFWTVYKHYDLQFLGASLALFKKTAHGTKMLTNLQTLLVWDAIRKSLDAAGYEHKSLKMPHSSKTL